MQTCSHVISIMRNPYIENSTAIIRIFSANHVMYTYCIYQGANFKMIFSCNNSCSISSNNDDYDNNLTIIIVIIMRVIMMTIIELN